MPRLLPWSSFFSSSSSATSSSSSALVISVLTVLLLLERLPQVDAFASWDASQALTLLRVSQEVFSSFFLVRDQDFAEVVLQSDQTICCTRYDAGEFGISLKKFGNSWTHVYKADALQAVFNGTCFVKEVGTCEEYTQCSDSDSSLSYPTDNSDGENVLMPAEETLFTTKWSRGVAKLEVWIREEQELVDQLAASSDDTVGEVLSDALAAIQCYVSDSISLGEDSLLEIFKLQVQAFAETVDDDELYVKEEAETILAAIQAVIQQIELQDCSTNVWANLQAAIVSSLTSSSLLTNLQALDFADLIVRTQFLQVFRTLEVLTSGLSLGLAAGLLAAFEQLQCTVEDSQAFALPSVNGILTAVATLAEALSSRFSTAASASSSDSDSEYESILLNCVARRASRMEAYLIDGLNGEPADISSLLPIDVCVVIFASVGYRLLEISPTTAIVVNSAETDISFVASDGVAHQVQQVDTLGLVYLSPTLTFSTRKAKATADFAFVDNDLILNFEAPSTQHLLRPAATLPTWSECEVEVLEGSCLSYRNGCESWCFMLDTGCHFLGYGDCVVDNSLGSCTAPNVEALSEHICAEDSTCFAFTSAHWMDCDTCPYVCGPEDYYTSSSGACVAAATGYYSPRCANDLGECTRPNIADSLLTRVLSFTTTGMGEATGCQTEMGCAAAHQTSLPSLAPPFTVESLVQLDADDIPSAWPSLSTRLAILFGVFPRWYLAVKRESTASCKICFYHENITRVSTSRRSSLACSEAVDWASSSWYHVAVVAKTSSSDDGNILFYRDGSLVSTASRTASARALYRNHAWLLLNVLHIGPPNANFAAELLEDSETEPYFFVDGATFFDFKIDEIRITQRALSSLSQGYLLTQRRYMDACQAPYESMASESCRFVVAYTPTHASEDQTSCESGYESCAAATSFCVPECPTGMERQADCSCDCLSGSYQTWNIQGIALVGSGTILNVSVYSPRLSVIKTSSGGTDKVSISFSSLTEVAAVAVRGGGTASVLSLRVVTSSGDEVLVPDLSNVDVSSSRDIVFHHARLHLLVDSTLTCSACPSTAIGSTLPRSDLPSCRCSSSMGRNWMGVCTTYLGTLPAPVISPSSGTYVPGTTASISAAASVVLPWLSEIRYSVGRAGGLPSVPSCTSTYSCGASSSAAVGSTFTSDFIAVYSEETTTIYAVICHPSYKTTSYASVALIGTADIDPPTCSAAGNFSDSNAQIYDRKVKVTLNYGTDAYGAEYRLVSDGTYIEYTGPFEITAQGVTIVEARSLKVDGSATISAQCSYRVDGAPRLTVGTEWIPVESDDGSVGDTAIRAYVASSKAYLTKRGAELLHLRLQAELEEDGSTDFVAADLQLQYRVQRGSEASWSTWASPASNGSLFLKPQALLKESSTTMRLGLQFRVKEDGYVWSSVNEVALLVLATRASTPAATFTLINEIGISDSWYEGEARQRALNQVHTVTLTPYTVEVLFAVATSWTEEDPLRTAAAAGLIVSSLSSGALLDQFTAISTSEEWGPDDIEEQCDRVLSSSSTSSGPIFCMFQDAFQVYGGTSLVLVSIADGVLESEVVTVAAPFLAEPDDSARFRASVEVDSPLVTVSSLPQDFVLPTASTQLIFTVPEGSHEGDRMLCVLKSQFKYKEWASGALAQAQIEDCENSWASIPSTATTYKTLATEAKEVGIVDNSASLNITVMTSVCEDGYLCAYPFRHSYLWIRERSAAPHIGVVTERSEGVSGVRSASGLCGMLWLLDTSEAYEASDEDSSLFFSLHTDILEDLEVGTLAAAPTSTSTVDSIEDAVRKTSTQVAAITISTWRPRVKASCLWPSICKLPLNGSMGEEAIRLVSDPPYLCAWALRPGRIESKTTCVLTDTLTSTAAASMDFDDEYSESFEAASSQDLGGVTVIAVLETTTTSSSSRRLSSEAPSVLPVTPESSLPSLFRSRVAPIDTDLNTSLTAAGITSALSTAVWSSWQSWDPTFVGEATRSDAQHLVAEVQSKTLLWKDSATEMWSDGSSTKFLIIAGKHSPPSLSFSSRDRSVAISGLSPASTLLYRWQYAGANDPLPPPSASSSSSFGSGSGSGGVALRSRQVGFGGVLTELFENHYGSTESTDECVDGATSDDLLCVLTGSSSYEVQPPDSGSAVWVLWASAYSETTELSTAAYLSVETQCQISASSSNALATASCGPGRYLLAGESCTAACEEGYAPSISSLACSSTTTEIIFECLEAPCVLPAVDGATENTSCTGASLASGSLCVPQCQDSLVPSEAALSCDRGVLSPRSWACAEDESLPMTLFIGLGGGATLCILLILCLLVWRLSFQAPIVVEPFQPPDALQEWLLCVNEVGPGICVFCGRNPETESLMESQHGPPTLFRCCQDCCIILSPLVSGGKASPAFKEGIAEADEEDEDAEWGATNGCATDDDEENEAQVVVIKSRPKIVARFGPPLQQQSAAVAATAANLQNTGIPWSDSNQQQQNQQQQPQKRRQSTNPADPPDLCSPLPCRANEESPPSCRNVDISAVEMPGDGEAILPVSCRSKKKRRSGRSSKIHSSFLLALDDDEVADSSRGADRERNTSLRSGFLAAAAAAAGAAAEPSLQEDGEEGCDEGEGEGEGEGCAGKGGDGGDGGGDGLYEEDSPQQPRRSQLASLQHMQHCSPSPDLPETTEEVVASLAMVPPLLAVGGISAKRRMSVEMDTDTEYSSQFVGRPHQE